MTSASTWVIKGVSRTVNTMLDSRDPRALYELYIVPKAGGSYCYANYAYEALKPLLKHFGVNEMKDVENREFAAPPDIDRPREAFEHFLNNIDLEVSVDDLRSLSEKSHVTLARIINRIFKIKWRGERELYPLTRWDCCSEGSLKVSRGVYAYKPKETSYLVEYDGRLVYEMTQKEDGVFKGGGQAGDWADVLLKMARDS